MACLNLSLHLNLSPAFDYLIIWFDYLFDCLIILSLMICLIILSSLNSFFIFEESSSFPPLKWPLWLFCRLVFSKTQTLFLVSLKSIIIPLVISSYLMASCITHEWWRPSEYLQLYLLKSLLFNWLQIIFMNIPSSLMLRPKIRVTIDSLALFRNLPWVNPVKTSSTYI